MIDDVWIVLSEHCPLKPKLDDFHLQKIVQIVEISGGIFVRRKFVYVLEKIKVFN